MKVKRSHKGGTLIRRGRDTSPLSPHMHGEKATWGTIRRCYLQAEELDLTRNQSCWHLDLAFQPLGLWANKFLMRRWPVCDILLCQPSRQIQQQPYGIYTFVSSFFAKEGRESWDYEQLVHGWAEIVVFGCVPEPELESVKAPALHWDWGQCDQIRDKTLWMKRMGHLDLASKFLSKIYSISPSLSMYLQVNGPKMELHGGRNLPEGGPP